jgi:diaminopimelate decarboxylase
MKPESFKINKKNHMELGGIDMVKLAEEFGTPLYVLDEETLIKNCEDYTKNLAKHYPNFLVAYASKALSTVGLLNLFAAQGLGCDVVSGGELFTALKSKIKKEDILFHGNNKSKAELEMAIQKGIKIVIDNETEIENILSINKKLKKKIQVLIRLKPEIEAHTHDFVKTGQIDSKFGIDKKVLLENIRKIIADKNITFLGLHAHIGSQIFDIEPFEDLIHILVNYSAQIEQKLKIKVTYLNLGGGIGIKYMPDDDPPNINKFIARIAEKIKEECKINGLALPKLVLEPGRSMVGRAGVTLYEVGAVKKVPGKAYIFVDGGMADNPRPILYKAKYEFMLANKAKNKIGQEEYAIAGKFCETGDILATNIKLPEAEAGDILVVFATGAYNYSMSSNYNRFCKPAMVLVAKRKAKILVKRETFEDIIRNDIWT